MPRPEVDGDLLDRRPGGHAPRRTRCSSTPPSSATSRSRLLLRAEARRAGRRLPHVPRGDRGHPEAADRVLDAGQGRHGRPHQTERVREAQQAVVEFLLINHPLDCPVCDKGGECPLQDISFGWGGGASRFIEPKRHFLKPLALSPLIAIDRERCILCYRCVRFTQEVSEDYQLVLQERGAHSVRRDVRRPPVRRAVQRQHHRAVPGRRADLDRLPLPRAPVGHRGLGLDLHAVPVAVQRRASPCATSASCASSARDHEEVDDGWLCDKGRFAYQSVHVDERITQPLVREGGDLRR